MPEKRIKVLLIEDNPDDAGNMRDALAKSKNPPLDVGWVDRLAKGLERLSKGGIDLVVTDLQLPDAKGLDSVIKTHGLAGRLPIVVLTASAEPGESLASQALQHGAQDYLVKGSVQVYPELLLRALRYAIERKQAEEKEMQLMEA